MKQITFDVTTKPSKKFTNGKIKDMGAGSIAVQLAIVVSANFDISHFKWIKFGKNRHNDNVVIGISKTINIPMNVGRNDFKPPFDAFKFKAMMHPGGRVYFGMEDKGKFYNIELTTERLIKYAKSLENLSVTLDVEEETIPPEHADSPPHSDVAHSDSYIDAGHDERMKERELSWIKLTIKRFKEWASDNKWMLIGIAVSFIAGVIFGKKIL